MRKVYAGMDVGSKECAAVVVDERGKMLDSMAFKTSERNLIDFGKKHRKARVMIEECEIAGWVRMILKPLVQQVVVSDPRRNAWVARGGNKNDSLDAAKLAELNRLGSFSEVWHPDTADMAGFRLLVKHYDETSRRLARVKVQIKACLRSQGVITTGRAVYGASGRKSALEQVENSMARSAIEYDYELLDYLTEAKAAARRQMLAASGAFPIVERFQKIPGVGPVVAARFVAYVADPNRFDKRTLASYACLSVVKRSSDGSPIGRECLSRAGNSSLKDLSKTVFERARAGKGPNGIKGFYEASLARTGSHTKARLNTQRKILALMLSMWKNGTEYCDELLRGEPSPVA